MIDDPGELGPNAERLLALVLSYPPHGAFLDLGVQYGGSSRILLTGAVERDNHVVGVDASPYCQFPSHPNYQSVVADSVTYLSRRIEPIDICFHDTMHVAEQVMCELYYAWPLLKIGGYCVFHDTNWPPDKHDTYGGILWDQPIVGILKFFHASDCVEMVSHPASWGMTFAEKLNDHDPRAGVDFGPAFDAHHKLMP